MLASEHYSDLPMARVRAMENGMVRSGLHVVRGKRDKRMGVRPKYKVNL